MPRNETLLRPSTVRSLNEPTLGVGAESDLPPWVVPVSEIVYTSRAQILEWCRLPYPRHPKGCPNAYGKCQIADGAETEQRIDTSKPMWIVYAEYDLAAHVEEMSQRHEHWSDVQCRNLLYWQPTSLTILNERVEQFLEIVRPQRFGRVTYLGESDGVHLWQTARRAGVPLETIKGMEVCRHCALICFER